MEHAHLRRKLIAVLLADVVGYSRLMGRDEDETHLRLGRIIEELVEPRATLHGGRLIRTKGDGMLIDFDSALDAVHCALEIQQGLAQHEEHVEPHSRIQLRMGINIGDVILDDKDIYGNSINIAARLEQLAEPGTICVSQAVHEQLRNYPGLSFSDRGTRKAKNIDHPIHVFRLEGVKTAAMGSPAPELHLPDRWRVPILRRGRMATVIVAVLAIAGTLGLVTLPGWQDKPAVLRQASILVLPFRNVSDDPGQEYVADAVTSNVTTDLSRMRDVIVISAATAFTYRGKSLDIKQINRDIGMRYLLLGNIRRIGQQVKTDIQLVEAASEVQLWGERFENEFVDLMKLEDSVTGRIAASLNVQLIRAEGRRAQRATTPDALDLRLHATSLFFQSVTPENVMTARQLLTQAVQLDPDSAEAWARLAQLTASDYLNHWNNTGPEQLDDAERAARKALVLDPNLALGHFAMAFTQRARGEHQLALEAFTRAIELDRNFAIAYARKGDELTLVGRPGEAQALVEKAIQLSPRDPSLGIFYWIIGRANFFAENYDQAISWLRKSVETRSNVWYNRLYLISAYALTGNVDQAKNNLQVFNRRFPEPTYTITQVVALEGSNPSNDPTVIAARDKFHDGLRLAGMAEN
ncbi:MAG TPA: adenylate/guanylate cyclase domain-containing protein [Stellaceae bacterium]|nr:adenylate/guanylate cyclase domain-containing protein [Stellaceae bacterium]